MKDFIEDIKERFGITEIDVKEKKKIFYIVKEKEKKQIDIFKDYFKQWRNYHKFGKENKIKTKKKIFSFFE